MNGSTRFYKFYYEYIKTMPEPVLPSQLPKRKMNLSAIAKYAETNHICVADLSAAEKELLIQKFSGV